MLGVRALRILYGALAICHSPVPILISRIWLQEPSKAKQSGHLPMAISRWFLTLDAAGCSRAVWRITECTKWPVNITRELIWQWRFEKTPKLMFILLIHSFQGEDRGRTYWAWLQRSRRSLQRGNGDAPNQQRIVMVNFRRSFRKEDIDLGSPFDPNRVGLIKQISLRLKKKCYKCGDVHTSVFPN